MDNASDAYRAKEFAEYQIRKSRKHIHHTFLYSFSSDYAASQAMAQKLAVDGLVMVDTEHVDGAIRERDRMVFSVITHHRRMKKRKRQPDRTEVGGGAQTEALTKQCLTYNYTCGDTPETVFLEKFLKKIDLVFQYEPFLETPGLFRVSGEKKRVDNIVEQFLQGETSLENLGDPHEVAHAVKNVLMWTTPILLPPIPQSLLQILDKSGKLPEDGKEKRDMLLEIGAVINRLPARNVNCLILLLTILHRVGQYNHKNQMTTQNLATIFVSHIFLAGEKRPPTSYEFVMTHILIENCHSIFV